MKKEVEVEKGLIETNAYVQLYTTWDGKEKWGFINVGTEICEEGMKEIMEAAENLSKVYFKWLNDAEGNVKA